MNATASGRPGTPHDAPAGHGDNATASPCTDRSVLARTAHVGHGARGGVVTGAERDQLAAGFGRKLVELRTGRALTQKAAAAKARISEDYWRHLEHGRRRPSPDLVALLGLILGGDDPWAVLEELLDLGGRALSGSGRRRFRTEAKRNLRALVKLPKVQKATEKQLARINRLTDRLERQLGAADQADAIRAATQAVIDRNRHIVSRQTDRASADRPLTSHDAGGAGSARTPGRPGGAP